MVRLRENITYGSILLVQRSIKKKVLIVSFKSNQWWRDPSPTAYYCIEIAKCESGTLALLALKVFQCFTTYYHLTSHFTITRFKKQRRVGTSTQTPNRSSHKMLGTPETFNNRNYRFGRAKICNSNSCCSRCEYLGVNDQMEAGSRQSVATPARTTSSFCSGMEYKNCCNAFKTPSSLS